MYRMYRILEWEVGKPLLEEYQVRGLSSRCWEFVPERHSSRGEAVFEAVTGGGDLSEFL